MKRCSPIEATTTSIPHNLLKTLLQTTVMWSFFLLIVPIAIHWAERQTIGWRLPEIPNWLAWAAFGILGATGIYCGLLFCIHGKGTPLPLDTTTQFLVLGPYRWIRNPMAFCGIGQGVMVGLLLRSPMVVIYSICGAVVWHVIARPWEERDLLNRFGQPYEEYRKAIRNWLPRLKPYPKIVQAKTTEPA